MSPTRRAPMDPRDPAWDRDREMAASDREPEPRRPLTEPGRSGMVIVYIVAGVLVVLVAIAVLQLVGWRR